MFTISHQFLQQHKETCLHNIDTCFAVSLVFLFNDDFVIYKLIEGIDYLSSYILLVCYITRIKGEENPRSRHNFGELSVVCEYQMHVYFSFIKLSSIG